MSEAAVVNLFFIFRVFLVGAIAYVMPRVTRKGLLFGAYVGKEVAEGKEGRRVLAWWDQGTLFVMALSLLIGLSISFAGYPVPGNLTGTAVLLTSFGVLFLKGYSEARRLVPAGIERQAEKGTATLLAGKPKGETFAKLTLLACIITGLATLAYAIVSYRGMPEIVPDVDLLRGRADGTAPKSLLTLSYAPGINLVLSPFYALMAWLISSAKISAREGAHPRSVRAQLAFRAIMANGFSGLALLICLTVAVYSIQVVRIALGQIETVGWVMIPLFLIIILYGAGILFRTFKTHGQGGALRERDAEDRPLTGALADNAHWLWGMFYVNREDPSMIIESRFGLGYTLNYGNPGAVLMVVAFVALGLTLVTLGVLL